MTAREPDWFIQTSQYVEKLFAISKSVDDTKSETAIFTEENKKEIEGSAFALWNILEKKGLKYREIKLFYGDEAVDTLCWQVVNAAFYSVMLGLIKKGVLYRKEKG